MFSLACALPSPISAEDCSPLFDRFTGTMVQSDPSEACLSAVWHKAFSDRSRLWLSREGSEVSRFSCMKFLSVRGVCDYAEREMLRMVCLAGIFASPECYTFLSKAMAVRRGPDWNQSAALKELYVRLIGINDKLMALAKDDFGVALV